MPSFVWACNDALSFQLIPRVCNPRTSSPLPHIHRQPVCRAAAQRISDGILGLDTMTGTAGLKIGRI